MNSVNANSDTIILINDPAPSETENPIDLIFQIAQKEFATHLEAADRDALLRKAIKKLGPKIDLNHPETAAKKVVKKAQSLAAKATIISDDEDDESVNEKNLPPAWKRHAVLLAFGAGAVATSTLPSQNITSLFFTLGFLKLAKSYMIGFPRIRRYLVLSSLAAGTLTLKAFWETINLTPLAMGLAIDGLAFTAKAYMKGKLAKDAGPQETNRILLCLQNGISASCEAAGSRLDAAAARISSLFSRKK